ncbi:MAG: TonB-dependent receptor plug domain-containing protein [Opitutus sp.]
MAAPFSLRAQTVSPTTDESGASPTRLEAVVVSGRAAELIGTASASSVGSVGYHELEQRPFLRRGELLEVIPGVVITQHSGGGKANQYFLRGFNLDHGTDFSITVDGMPVNLRSHAHGQGYADLNFIVPEFVQSVDYNKGPFAPEVGDFSAAGAARFSLFRALPANFATLEVGENNYARWVMGDTILHSGTAATTVGFEATQDNGPWVLPEELRRYSGLVRHTWTGSNGQQFSLTALGYQAKWNSTDQVPLRAVASGQRDRYGNIDPTDGGKTERFSFSFDGTLRAADSVTRIMAYAISYELDLFSNFTYFLDDPVNGDQFNQRDRRTVLGVNVEQSRTINWFGRRSETAVGVQVRDDLIGELALRHTAKRVLIDTVRDDGVQEASIGFYAQATTHWSSRMRTDVGVRADAYQFQVDSDNSLNSGDRSAAMVSPKFGAVFGPWAKTEVYLNAGLGFHSNDARGATIRVDPTDGITPIDRVNPLVRSRGFEAGVRTSWVPGLVSTVSLWTLDLDSELVFVGDAGGTEPSGATRRTGVEWANYYRANPWLTFDADVSFTHARYRDGAPDDRIANSIGTVVTAGVVFGHEKGVFGSVRLRYFGEQPIVEDNSAIEPPSTTVNARFGWKNEQWEIAVSVLNALNRKNDDIAYYYTSRLPGEPASGVDDVHFHPAEPRTIRLSATRRF